MEQFFQGEHVIVDEYIDDGKTGTDDIHEGGAITIQFKGDDQYKRIVDFIENNKYTLTVAENKVGG